MNEKAYDTASLGETSADEMTVPQQEAGDVEIYRDSELDRNLNERLNLASAVADYEQEVVQDHLALDLYRSKGKKYAQISFNDLSVMEQLNYVKYNLKDTKEALQMFDIVTADE